MKKRILLTRNFQASQSWHQLTVYENKILVQNCLLIEWTLTYLFFWWFLNLERNFGVRKWSKITALLANLYLVKAREKKSIFCHMYWNLNWLKNWNLNENQNRKFIAKFHMQHLVVTPLYIGLLKVSYFLNVFLVLSFRPEKQQKSFYSFLGASCRLPY